MTASTLSNFDSNPAHTHATISKQMFVLYNTSRCNSCFTAGPKHWRNVHYYKTNKTRDYHKTNSPTCSLLGNRTPLDILWSFGGKPKASALQPDRSSRRCLRLPLGPVTVGYFKTDYMLPPIWNIGILHIHIITVYSLSLFTEFFFPHRELYGRIECLFSSFRSLPKKALLSGSPTWW